MGHLLEARQLAGEMLSSSYCLEQRLFCVAVKRALWLFYYSFFFYSVFSKLYQTVFGLFSFRSGTMPTHSRNTLELRACIFLLL